MSVAIHPASLWILPLEATIIFFLQEIAFGRHVCHSNKRNTTNFTLTSPDSSALLSCVNDTCGHVDFLDLCCHLWSCWSAWAALPPEDMLMWMTHAVTRRCADAHDPCCYQGLCLGLWSWCSCGSRWYLWPVLPSKVVWMSSVPPSKRTPMPVGYVATWSHVDAYGLPVVCVAAWVHVDIHGLGSFRSPY